MGYWADRKRELPATILEHPWAAIFHSSLERCRPKLIAELSETDEVDAYVAVRVHDAVEEYEQYLQGGMDASTARELVMDSLMPVAEDEGPLVEDWEIEGAQEDQIAALESFFRKRESRRDSDGN